MCMYYLEKCFIMQEHTEKQHNLKFITELDRQNIVLYTTATLMSKSYYGCTEREPFLL